MFKFTITKNTLKDGLARVRRDFPTRKRVAMQDVADEILAAAKERVPVKTGALRDSGRVEMDDARRARIVFGNPDVDYAVRVHENLEAEHENGQAKFLQSALNDAAGSMANRLASRMRFDKWVDGSKK